MNSKAVAAECATKREKRLNNKNPHAVEMGRKGGKVRSAVKSEALRVSLAKARAVLAAKRKLSADLKREEQV